MINKIIDFVYHDTVIIVKGDTWLKVKQKASVTLENILNWLNKNLLTLNINKTKYIPFSSYKNGLPILNDIIINISNNFNKQYDETKISATLETKYLGLIIDCHLKWENHIQYMCNKIRHLMTYFFKLREILNITNLIIIYYSLVQAVLSYGIIAWGGCSKTFIQKLITVQKCILKIILHKPKTYNSELVYLESKVFSIYKLYTFNILKYYNNYINRVYITHNYETRKKINKDVITNKVIKHIGQQSFEFIAPKMYNILPKEIKNIIGTSKFNKELKVWLSNITDKTIEKVICIYKLKFLLLIFSFRLLI